MRGGTEGNERLTSSAGLVLFVLLAVEALTTLSLHSYLPVHVFLGLLLIPPVALKLASTGWRFVRYYSGNEDYRLLGPPQLPLRLMAPVLVAATVVLFGTGVSFLVVGHGGGLLLTLHAASFAVWGVAIGIHVLAYLGRVVRFGLADLRFRKRHPGRTGRFALVGGALVLGLIVAGATYPAQSSWLAHRHHRHHDFGRDEGSGKLPAWTVAAGTETSAARASRTPPRS
jgi:hypothetical protein